MKARIFHTASLGPELTGCGPHETLLPCAGGNCAPGSTNLTGKLADTQAELTNTQDRVKTATARAAA
jgi:hypothetical protein